MRRALAVVVALLVGVVAGAVFGLSRGPPGAERPGRSRSAERVAAATPGPTSSSLAVAPIRARTLLAWTPGRLPEGFAAGVAGLPGVRHVVAVTSGDAWLSRSSSADGRQVDRPPPGLRIPMEVAAADPSTYSPFVTPAHRPLLGTLARGQALLGASSAAFRSLGAGATLWFGRRAIEVAGVLPDAEVGAHEVLVSASTARRIGVTRQRYLLIDTTGKVSRPRLSARIRALLPSGVPVRIRGPGETPYFREGDAVLPQIAMKETFGEFAAAPLANGFLRVDPAWQRGRIQTTRVPILGTVTCNRALLPMLRDALGDLQAQGLARLIHPGEYGGCYAPRFINEDARTGISHHAWGAAVDLDVPENAFGATPRMDPRLVRTFERWGFTWGGRWMVPDGMHFEFLEFPSGQPST